MFKSLKVKIACIFIATLLSILVLFFSMSSLLMQRYYIYREEKNFIEIYNEISAMAESGKSDKDINYSLSHMVANSNVAVVISDSEFSQVYSSTNLFNKSQNDNGVFYNPKEILSKIKIPQGEKYKFEIIRDQYGKFRMFLKGNLVGDYFIFLTKPVEPIIKSVDIYKDFFLLLSIPVSLIGAFVSYLISRKITEPIYEMIDISRRIAKLDFSKKYVPQGDGEINALGLSLNTMSETLSKNITQLYRANTMLKNDISQRERNEEMRKEFLQNASHELKTPIAVIGSYGQMLKEGLITDKEDLDYYYDVICDETEKMTKIVKELLVLAQLESYRDILNIEKFDMSELTNEVLETYDVIFKAEDIKLKAEISEKLTVSADRTLIERVMSNYISNAIYHIQNDDTVYVTLKNTDEGVYFSVKNKTAQTLDNQKIWQSFYKDAHSSGNGLGLSIVKAIMEVHNKKFGVKTENGFVEFYILL